MNERNEIVFDFIHSLNAQVMHIVHTITPTTNRFNGIHIRSRTRHKHTAIEKAGSHRICTYRNRTSIGDR